MLGAFALTEWQDARTRADALVAAIRSELEANLALQLDAVIYNSDVAEKIWAMGRAGVLLVPTDLYPRGLLQRPPLTSAAWDVARDDALDDVPVDILVAVAAAYGEQRDYLDSTGALLLSVHTTLFQHEGATLRVDGISEPLGIGGMLGGYADRGARLVERYRAALERLNAKAR